MFPLGTGIAETKGEKVGHVYIPSIYVDEDIYFAPLDGGVWDSNYWSNNVAHLEGTGWINQSYNVVLVSHDTGPLFEITKLMVGDDILVYDDNYIALYKVDQTYITNIYDMNPVMPTRDGITLIICYGKDRYIVSGYKSTLQVTS